MPTFFFITHYASHGGCSNNGSYCGVFYVLTTSFSWDHWDFGAALCVHIMLNVAVFLEIRLSVVLLMFLLLISILILFGVLVLIYHCTHYALRGRDSYGREFCGCWIVSFNSDYSYNVWLIGAALSYTLCFSWRWFE